MRLPNLLKTTNLSKHDHFKNKTTRNKKKKMLVHVKFGFGCLYLSVGSNIPLLKNLGSILKHG